VASDPTVVETTIHAGCPKCVPAGLETALCGSPLVVEDVQTEIVEARAPHPDDAMLCVVCFSGELVCSNCGTRVNTEGLLP
jgi:hypothetical protein